MRRVYAGLSYAFIVGGAVLFVGAMIETALSADRSPATFVLAGFGGGLAIGLGFVFRVLAAAREISAPDPSLAHGAVAHEVKRAIEDGRHSEALDLAAEVIARESRDPERQTVVRYVGRIGTPEAVEWLRERLDDENPGVVAFAAQSVGDLGDRESVPQLQGLLASSDFVVRLNAAFALGLLPHRSSVAPLASALDDRAWRVRGSAVKALAKIHAPEAALALQSARSHSWRTRRAARRAGRRLQQDIAAA